MYNEKKYLNIILLINIMENSLEEKIINFRNQLVYLLKNSIKLDGDAMTNFINNVCAFYKQTHDKDVLHLFIVILNDSYLEHKNEKISQLCLKYSMKYLMKHEYEAEICAIGAQHAELINKYDITIGLYSMALLYCKNTTKHIYLNNLAGIYFSIMKSEEGIRTFFAGLDTLKKNITSTNFDDYMCLYSNVFLHLLYQEPKQVNNYERIMELEKPYYLSFIRKKYERLVIKVDNYHNNKIKKIAIISNDFHAHPVGYMILSLIKYYQTIYDKYQLELYILDNGDKVDRVLDFILSFKNEHIIWKKINNTEDEKIIKYIYDEHIDIIIDMMGYTNRNKMSILAYLMTLDKTKRPYIYSYFAFPARSGVCDKKIIDKNIYDLIVKQSSDKNDNIILKYGLQCYHYPVVDIPIQKVKSDIFRIACFNNPNKITDKIIEIWSKILINIPNSVLVLYYKSYQSNMVIQQFISKFENLGVNKNKIQFGFTLLIQLLNLYNTIDVALDPTPYNGGCISSEALYMNTPVICFHPDNDVYDCSVNIDTSYQSAVSYTLNKTLGFDELICHTKNEYINKVIELSKNSEKLNWYHTNIRSIMKEKNLLDSECFMSDFIDKIINI